MPPKPARPAYTCTECGWTTSKWVGRCGECQAWGTVDEVGVASAARTKASPVTSPAIPMTEVDTQTSIATTSGIPEFDRVLGGGVVPGAVLLLAGEPGVGKSTLLLEAAARWARKGERTLYVSGEESAGQVRMRAERTGAVEPLLYLAAETDLGAVLSHIEQVKPTLLIVDSVQTIGSAGVDGVPGGVTQVREVAATLVQVAKTKNIATLLVGHVTKDGSVAGPRVLEHLVDVVLQFEGDRNSRLRLLRAVKNRFGPIDEIGCFDLVDDGIVEVPDPTGLFVSRHVTPVAGTCVTVTMEGRRPLLAEVQALAIATTQTNPRRTTSGLDSSRVSMILAVLTRHCDINLLQHDVYAATVGGAKLTEPAVDLAVAIAAASALENLPIGSHVVAIGEVGLAGEVRKVSGLGARIREAARIGFTHAIVP
ncbi:MAG: repair protein RadA, partial [Nocardioidaceae bacterium]|nr:repair protein RadA [Nocardioidaceae bacterium]